MFQKTFLTLASLIAFAEQNKKTDESTLVWRKLQDAHYSLSAVAGEQTISEVAPIKDQAEFVDKLLGFKYVELLNAPSNEQYVDRAMREILVSGAVNAIVQATAIAKAEFAKANAPEANSK